jgi:hypothetical protein
MEYTMDNITKCNASTKPTANGDAVVTAFTFNWADVSPEEIRAMAQSALVIKMQSQFRRDAVKQGAGIPTEITVNVVDHKPGTRAARPQKSIMEQIATMTAEQRAELLAQLTAA